MPISMALPIASLFSLPGCFPQISSKTATAPVLPEADCLVTNETDLTYVEDWDCVIDPETGECFGDELEAEARDIYAHSLRYMVELYNNGGGCTVPAGTTDDGVYDQAIYFATDEWDSTDSYSDHVDEPIVVDAQFFNGPFTFDGLTGTLAIGNWNSETTPSTEDDYGNVTLDAEPKTSITDPWGNPIGEPFECGTNQAPGSVTLRNLTINVCSASLLADGALFDGTYSCLVDGGAVTVVPTSDCSI